VFLAWMAAAHPLLTAVIVVVLVIGSVLLIWKLYGYLKLLGTRLRHWREGKTASPT
jgi:hypothetical protein